MKFKAGYITLQGINSERYRGNDKGYTNKIDSLVTDVFYKDFSCQYDCYRNNASCTCKRKKRDESGYFSTSRQVYRSVRYSGVRGFSDVGVGNIKTIPRKRVRRIYLLETEDRGVGSSDLTPFIQQTRNGQSYYDQKKTSSKCVGDAMECNTTSVISKKLSPICNTKSGSNSPTNASFKESKDYPDNDKLNIFPDPVVKIDIGKTQAKDDKYKKDQEIIIVEQTWKDNTDANKAKKPSLPIISQIKSVSVELDDEKNDFSSDSLVQHVHNLENPSSITESKISLDFTGNTLEREYIKMFETNSKQSVKPVAEVKPIQDCKSASLRKRFEALRCGLGKKEVNKEHCIGINSNSYNDTLRKDVSIASDPPSLEARSFINANSYSVTPPSLHKYEDVSQISYMQPLTDENESSHWSTEVVDGDYQNAKGMFKLWGKKFKLDEDYHKESSSHTTLEVTQKPKKKVELILPPKEEVIEKEKKEGKRFLFFKKKNRIEKSKQPFKSKNGVTTGRCEVGDGLTVKIGAPNEYSPEAPSNKSKKNPGRHDDLLRKAWLNRCLDKKNDSRKSVKIRWNNDMYTTSSSTVFELMECIYKNSGIIFRSKSEMTSSASANTGVFSHYNPQVNYAQQTIQAWMIPKLITDNNIEEYIKIQNSNKKHNNDIEVTFSNQKWFIDKSKGFSRKTELVLNSNNVVSDENSESSNYIVIDIPRGYFSGTNSEDDEQTTTSDEQVYNIVEYETVKSISNLENKRIDRKLDIGDHQSNEIRVTINVQDKKVKKSKAETVKKTPPLHRDVVIQGSNVHIPKRCDVIGVGIITRHTPNRNIKDIKKPKLKMQDDITDDESTFASFLLPQKKCELAETYLRDYYRNWTPLGQDLYTGCISDNNVRCSSDDNSLNSYQEDGSKSCPNINDDYYQTSSTVSSVETSYYHPFSGMLETMKCEDPITFFNKFQKNEDPSHLTADGKRVLPKDSVEVFKHRKIYVASKLANLCWSAEDLQRFSVPSIGDECAQEAAKDKECCTANDFFSEDSDAAKKVKMSKPLDCEIKSNNRTMDGIMSTKKYCNAKKKKARVNPDPVEIQAPIQDKKPCLNIVPHKYPICSRKSSYHTSLSQTKSSPMPQTTCKGTAPSPPQTPPSPRQTLPSPVQTLPSPPCKPNSPPSTPPSSRCKRPSPPLIPPSAPSTPHSAPSTPHSPPHTPPSPRCKLPSPPLIPPSAPRTPASRPCILPRTPPSPPRTPPSQTCTPPSQTCTPPSQTCTPPSQTCTPPSLPSTLHSPTSTTSSPPCTPPPSKYNPRHTKSSPTSSTNGPSSQCCQQTPTRQHSSSNLARLCGCSRQKSCGSPQCCSSYKSPSYSNTASQSLKNETSPTSHTITDIFKRFVRKCDPCLTPPTDNICGKLDSNKQMKSPVQDKCEKCGQTNTNSRPKMTGLHIAKKPIPRNTSSISQPNCNVIKLNSKENVFIRIKEGTPSTDEIRDHHNIKVQDKDGHTLYERHEYKANACDTKDNLLKDMYRNSRIHRVATSKTEAGLNNKKIVSSHSIVSLENIVEIKFNLKFKQPDKTTEVNIKKDKLQDIHNKVRQSTSQVNLKDVYVLQDKSKQSIAHIEDPEKKDVNIKIVINSYRQDINKSKRKVDSFNFQTEDDFSRKISEKFHTVSTGYSDVLDIQTYSIQTTTVNFSDSTVASKQLMKPSEELVSEKLTQKRPTYVESAVKHSTFEHSHSSVAANIIEEVQPSVPRYQELPSDISRNTGLSATDNEDASDIQNSNIKVHKTRSKDKKNKILKNMSDHYKSPNNIEKLYDQELPSEISLEMKSGISATDNEDEKKKISKHILDRSHDSNNTEKVYDQELPSDISRNTGISDTDVEGVISDVQESNFKIRKIRNKEEKKKILKQIFENATGNDSQNTGKKSRMGNIRKMLQAVLTSDSSGVEDVTNHDLAKKLTGKSLKPKYSIDTESMTNYYQLGSSMSDNRFSSRTRNNSTDIAESNDNQNLRCPCNHMAKALNTCCNNLTSCGCQIVYKSDKEVTCDLIEDVLKIKKDVETQDSFFKDNRKKSVVQFQNVDNNHIQTHSNLKERIKRSVVLIASNTDAIYSRNVDDTDDQCNNFSRIPKRMISYMDSMKKLKNRQTLLGLSDDDKVIILNSESQKLKTEVETVYRNSNLLKPLDILQLHETKKAVLEIYSEKVVFNREVRRIAKLPKFVYNKESQICNYYKEVVNDHQHFSARNIMMMSINR